MKWWQKWISFPFVWNHHNPKWGIDVYSVLLCFLYTQEHLLPVDSCHVPCFLLGAVVPFKRKLHEVMYCYTMKIWASNKLAIKHSIQEYWMCKALFLHKQGLQWLLFLSWSCYDCFFWYDLAIFTQANPNNCCSLEPKNFIRSDKIIHQWCWLQCSLFLEAQRQKTSLLTPTMSFALVCDFVEEFLWFLSPLPPSMMWWNVVAPPLGNK